MEKQVSAEDVSQSQLNQIKQGVTKKTDTGGIKENKKVIQEKGGKFPVTEKEKKLEETGESKLGTYKEQNLQKNEEQKQKPKTAEVNPRVKEKIITKKEKEYIKNKKPNKISFVTHQKTYQKQSITEPGKGSKLYSQQSAKITSKGDTKNNQVTITKTIKKESSNSKEIIPIKKNKKIKEKNEETIPIERLKKMKKNEETKNIENIGEIVNKTKIIIYSPEDEIMKNKKTLYYNTFCTFKSIDNIFYLVYTKKEYMVFYNLIDEKKVTDIKTGHDYLIELKYLFDEINKRDLLISLSEYSYVKLWNINNLECLFDIKTQMYIRFNNIDERKNYLGIIKLSNKNFNIIVFNDYDNEGIKIFDINGNILNKNYRKDLKEINNNFNIDNLIFIDTYYDKKICKCFIFIYDYLNKLYSFDYEKKELYQKYGEMGYSKGYNQIIINDDDENLIKIIYAISYGSIGIFNLHSGKLIYKINFKIIPIPNKIDNHYEYIYSLSYWNNNYISLSYGKVMKLGVKKGLQGARYHVDKRYHSIKVINIKEGKMKQVLNMTEKDRAIYSKKIVHPKYGDCLVTQDDYGEIKLIQIKLE